MTREEWEAQAKDAENDLRRRYPNLFARFDAAFKLIEHKVKGLDWIVTPSVLPCGGVDLMMAMRNGLVQVHMHIDELPTDTQLAAELEECVEGAVQAETYVNQQMFDEPAPTKH
jgi:hypothetical protein